MNNYYSILGIPSFSDTETIKKAFRELSKKYHPDNFGNISEEEKQSNLEKQQELNNIYSILSNKEKKEEYDYKLRRSSYDNSQTVFNGNFRDFYEKDIEPYENGNSFSFTFDEEELKSFFYYEQSAEFIKKQQFTKQQSDLEQQLSRREREIRMGCISVVANMKSELSKLDVEIREINESAIGIRQTLKDKNNQLVDLYNKKLYQMMPSRYKVVEDILLKEIEKIETKLTLLETKLAEKKEEYNTLNSQIIYYERNTIDNDSEVIRLRNEIKNIELELENLKGRSKVS